MIFSTLEIYISFIGMRSKSDDQFLVDIDKQKLTYYRKCQGSSRKRDSRVTVNDSMKLEFTMGS
jgi:hypothetical protein